MPLKPRTMNGPGSGPHKNPNKSATGIDGEINCARGMHQVNTGWMTLRRVISALHSVLQRLQWGQVVLATVGATAPFVGLLGTVWGIYHALTGIASAGQLSIEQVAGPVGEALIMTAAGLGVALPAVLAFNVMGRMINRLEHELEGFAHDVRAL
jgi:biopolymer transport protein ExbB